MWKRSHGRAREAPPNERGGNRYVRPTATAPHLDSTDSSPLLPSKLGTAFLWCVRDCWWARRLAPSIGERVGAKLEMEGDRNGALAAFLRPRRSVAACRPHPAPFPSALGLSMQPPKPLA